MSIDSNFVTGDLCDANKAHSDVSFRVLPPAFRDYGKRVRFAGTVSTVKCFEDNSCVKAALEEPGLGRVLVVDGGGSLRRALVGGNIAAGDHAELAQCDIGIRALALVPMPTERRNQGQRDVAVQVQGTWVLPGERLVADEDGIVVMPSPPA